MNRLKVPFKSRTQLGPRADAQLAERFSQVVLDSAHADEQLLGHLTVRSSLRYKGRDLCLLSG